MSALRRVAAVLILCTGVEVHAGMYRWVDEHGQVHFGDRPPVDVQTSEVKVRINTFQGVNVQALDSDLGGTPEVVIYSTSWCHVCTKAKSYFRANNIDYVEYDVETNAQGKRDYQRMSGRGVPIILVGRKRLNGFSSASFERLYRAPD
jgi:glutaredoxin